ncbi:hypothetical protein DENSPDRAFT_898244, partial [Dentipellis sp. KUC8613]
MGEADWPGIGKFLSISFFFFYFIFFFVPHRSSSPSTRPRCAVRALHGLQPASSLPSHPPRTTHAIHAPHAVSFPHSCAPARFTAVFAAILTRPPSSSHAHRRSRSSAVALVCPPPLLCTRPRPRLSAAAVAALACLPPPLPPSFAHRRPRPVRAVRAPCASSARSACCPSPPH